MGDEFERMGGDSVYAGLVGAMSLRVATRSVLDMNIALVVSIRW